MYEGIKSIGASGLCPGVLQASRSCMLGGSAESNQRPEWHREGEAEKGSR